VNKEKLVGADVARQRARVIRTKPSSQLTDMIDDPSIWLEIEVTNWNKDTSGLYAYDQTSPRQVYFTTNRSSKSIIIVIFV
jgi:hypothetical protein